MSNYYGSNKQINIYKYTYKHNTKIYILIDVMTKNNYEKQGKMKGDTLFVQCN
jgi:hypothetical protein